MLDGVFFDFDGVVVESSGLKHRLFVELTRNYSDSLAELLEYALDNELAGAERRHIATWLEKHSSGGLGADCFIKQFEDALGQQLPNVELKAGFSAFFGKLRRLQVKTAIISNAPMADILQVLESHRLDRGAFDAICGFTPRGKAFTLRRLLKRFALGPDRVLFIGDMPSDLEVASELGTGFIRIQSESGSRCTWPLGSYEVHSDFTTIDF